LFARIIGHSGRAGDMAVVKKQRRVLMRSHDVRTEECRNLRPTSRRGNFAKYTRKRESCSPNGWPDPISK